MVETVRQYIRNCHVCVRARLAQDRQKKLLPLPVPQQSWNYLAMDLIIKLPVFSNAYYMKSYHIWIIIDQLT